MSAVTYRRTVTRFALHYFVRFRWHDEAGLHSGEGTTLDLSSKGLFILTDTLPPINSVIRCWFCMPTLDQHRPEHMYEATLVARVVRTNATRNHSGFAASARAVVLTDREEPESAGPSHCN